MSQTFRLKKDGRLLGNIRHGEDGFNGILMMMDDFSKEFPWLNVYGFGGQGGVAFHAIYKLYKGQDSNGKDKYIFSATGTPYNIPEEVMYTMLKLLGVDVSRYGFDEEWEKE